MYACITGFSSEAGIFRQGVPPVCIPLPFGVIGFPLASHWNGCTVHLLPAHVVE